MNDRPTPITDKLRQTIRELYKDCLLSGDGMGVLLADVGRFESIEHQLASKTEECEGWEKQWREAAMNALTDKTRDELAEAREVIRKMELAIQHHEKRAGKALEMAGELIAMIRVNVMRGTFREATIEQVDDHLKPWIQRITTLNQTTQ